MLNLFAENETKNSNQFKENFVYIINLCKENYDIFCEIKSNYAIFWKKDP